MSPNTTPSAATASVALVWDEVTERYHPISAAMFGLIERAVRIGDQTHLMNVECGDRAGDANADRYIAHRRRWMGDRQAKHLCTDRLSKLRCGFERDFGNQYRKLLAAVARAQV